MAPMILRPPTFADPPAQASAPQFSEKQACEQDGGVWCGSYCVPPDVGCPPPGKRRIDHRSNFADD